MRYWDTISLLSIACLMMGVYSPVSAEHGGAPKTGRSLSQGAHGNCMESLSSDQLHLLSQIKNKLDSKSGQPTVEQIHEIILRSNLTPSQQNAVAAMAYGNVISRSRMEGFKSASPEEMKKLGSLGAYTNEKLDFKNMDWNRLKEARSVLTKVFPEQAAQIAQLGEEGFNKPVMLGDQVIMPAAYDKDSKARVLSVQEYQTSIKNLEQSFQSAMENFSQAATEAGGVWDQAKNAFFGKNGEESAATKRMNDWSDRAIKIVNKLSQVYGYPFEKAISLRDSISEGLRQANAKIDKGLGQFQTAAAVAVAAPLIYPAVALVTGAATLVGTSAALTGASAAVSASINKAYGNGDFLCSLGKNLLEEGAGSFAKGLLFGGAIGGAFRMTPWALKLMGLSEGVANGITTVAAGGLLVNGLNESRKEFVSARQLHALASIARAEGKADLAEEYERLARTSLGNGTLGVASTVVLSAAAKAYGNSATLPGKVPPKSGNHTPEGPVVTIQDSRFGHASISDIPSGKRYSNNPLTKTKITPQTQLPKGIHIELPPEYQISNVGGRSLSCVNGVCRILQQSGIQAPSGSAQYIPSVFLRSLLQNGLLDAKGNRIPIKIYQVGDKGPRQIATISDINLSVLPTLTPIVLGASAAAGDGLSTDER